MSVELMWLCAIFYPGFCYGFCQRGRHNGRNVARGVWLFFSIPGSLLQTVSGGQLWLGI
ncbi:hypothetical protein IWX50DRAFT_629166 [Phyllosticta citricarpa]